MRKLWCAGAVAGGMFLLFGAATPAQADVVGGAGAARDPLQSALHGLAHPYAATSDWQLSTPMAADPLSGQSLIELHHGDEPDAVMGAGGYGDDVIDAGAMDDDVLVDDEAPMDLDDQRGGEKPYAKPNKKPAVADADVLSGTKPNRPNKHGYGNDSNTPAGNLPTGNLPVGNLPTGSLPFGTLPLNALAGSGNSIALPGLAHNLAHGNYGAGNGTSLPGLAHNLAHGNYGAYGLGNGNQKRTYTYTHTTVSNGGGDYGLGGLGQGLANSGHNVAHGNLGQQFANAGHNLAHGGGLGSLTGLPMAGGLGPAGIPGFPGLGGGHQQGGGYGHQVGGYGHQGGKNCGCGHLTESASVDDEGPLLGGLGGVVPVSNNVQKRVGTALGMPAGGTPVDDDTDEPGQKDKHDKKKHNATQSPSAAPSASAATPATTAPATTGTMAPTATATVTPSATPSVTSKQATADAGTEDPVKADPRLFEEPAEGVPSTK
ncbi:hypothetical protein [Actinoplanes rectilineatus]|uniref:hypothetical protein n=1 Tax=Actinoplanes rectilineatus TaxID=113571 RepID=UPI000ACF41B3|nr:hypothetical protein [Actinoplanes rectilineatus]